MVCVPNDEGVPYIKRGHEMKELYVNNTGKMLIDKKGFFIVDTSALPASIIKHSFFLDRWGALNIVSFADADMLCLDQFDKIQYLLSSELSAFKESLKADALIYYKVFVTENGMNEDTVNIIMANASHSLYVKTSLIPIVIDIKNKQVIMPDRKGSDALGLYKLFSEALKKIESFDRLYDLEEAEREMRNEYGYSELESHGKTRKPYASYVIIALNILIFAATSMLGGMNNFYMLMLLGAKVNSLIVKGQYWRLISSAFLHAGLAHIAFNMYGLYNLGSIVEKIYGSRKFLFIYFLSALSGSISSFAFSPNPSVGASGAIFGLMGALLYLGYKKPRLFSTSFGVNILVVLIVNIIFGFSNAGIDNLAHIGGLVGGYLASNITGMKNEKGMTIKKAASFALTAVLLWGIFLLGMFRW